MKIYFYNYLFLLVSLFVLSGCEDEERYGSQGAFSISLVDDLTGMVVTKSTPSELGAPLASQFKLQIKNTQTGALSYEGLCNKTYYEVPAATYDLFANYGENPILAFDSPYYKGELANQAVGVSGKNVVIPCSVGNALVSIKYVNQSVFDAVFTSYGIVATVGDLSLNWPSEHAQKSVYFRAGSFVSFVFKGILKAGSKEITFPLKQDLPETYKAKDHYTLRLTYQAGQSKLDITTEKKEATINQTVPQDWLPKPSTESADFTDKVLIMKETMSPNAIINLKVARPLQDLKFKLELEDPNFQSLNKEYTLSTLSEQDMATLKQAGIILPAIGSSEPSINIGGLTSKLQTINGGETVNNYISINPKANNRWNAVEDGEGEKYTIQVEKPEFKVEVYPGDIWTKEFTITPSVLSGNADVLIPGFKYEYSVDGEIWQEASNKNTVKNLTIGGDYKTRIKYRDIVSESLEVLLETPVQIPNSNLESWYLETINYPGGFLGIGKMTYYNYYPYVQGGGENSWWSTNNSRSQAWTVAPVEVTTCPIVSYVYDVHSGSKAAEIRTSGSGGGYASTGSIIYPESAFPGKLFIGSYNWADKQEMEVHGHTFTSRPTKLSFWYKYAPYKTDAFRVNIEIQNRNNEAITALAKGIFISDEYSTADGEYQYKEIILTYDEMDKTLNATHICLEFVSTIKQTFESSDLQKKVEVELADVKKWQAHVGSRLKIDDITLIYEK